jgi:hypothetical protein
VRRAISAFALIDNVDVGLRRLESDLEDGTWERLYGYLRHETSLDLGYRLVTAERGVVE